MAMNGQIVRCPVCRAPNTAHEGAPPDDDPRRFRNRCTARRLKGTCETGYPGGLVDSSWKFPPRESSTLCGAPLTSLDGRIIPPPDMSFFIRITRLNNFLVDDIAHEAYREWPRELALYLRLSSK